MSEPARVPEEASIHKLHEHRPLSPQAQTILIEQVTDLHDRLNAVTGALTSEKRTSNRLRKQIRDLLAESTDTDTVMKCLGYWAVKTGHHDTRLMMSGVRADHVRWVLRHYTPREFCTAILGLIHDPFYAEKGLDEVHHLMLTKQEYGGPKYDEAKFEKFLKRGKQVLGE